MSGQEFLEGGGECGALMRAYDWSASPLGHSADWPDSLKTLVNVMLGSAQPMAVAWGPERTTLYNDGYAEICQDRHPRAMGIPFRELWWDIMDALGPIFDRAMAGIPTQMDDSAFYLTDADGVRRERHFSFSFTPLRDGDGSVPGMFCACYETTGKVNADAARGAERAKLLAMFDQAPGFMAILDGPEHRIAYANTAYQERMGHRVAIGLTVAEAIPEALEQGFIAMLDKVFQGAEPLQLDGARFLARQPDGSVVEQFVDVVYQPLKNDAGQVTGLFVEGHSVTDRILAEGKAEARQAELEQVMRAAPAAIWIGRNGRGGAIEANAMGHTMLGLTHDTPMGVDGPPQGKFTNGRFVHADGRAYGPDDFPLARAIAGERVEALEVEIAYDDAPSKFLLINAQPFGSRKGGGAVAVGIDITERRLLYDELQALNADLEARVEKALADRSILADIVDETEAQVQVLALDYRVLAINKAAAQRFAAIFGVTPRIGDNILDLLAPWPLHQANAKTMWGRAFAGEAFTENRDIASPSGERRIFEVHLQPLRDRDGAIFAAYQFVYDVTDRLRTEARLRTIFDTSLQFQGLLDPEGVLLEANNTSLEGIRAAAADVIGHKFWDTPWFTGTEGTPARVEYAIREIARTKQPISREVTVDLPTGRRSFTFSIRPILDGDERLMGFITEGSETTALRAAESALLQAQKLESMGQLTGGVAHDFNNLLTPILGALDLLQRRGLGNELERSLIEGAMQSAERARILVQRLLAFARRQPLQTAPVDIGKLISGMGDLIERTTGPQIRVLADAGEDLPAAIVDANQLELAILNLAVNARDAMDGAGTLRITATQESVDTLDAPVQPGRYVVILIADDGEGMDDETIKRAIEPFFSTKGIGKGTGLGLSMAHGLASQLGGALTIDSRPGLGTNIRLWLPATERAPAAALAEAEPVKPSNGTILLVDDEPLVRASTAEMLVEIGYSVTEADSGDAALAELDCGLSPDFLVTDHLMPGMDGPELAAAALARHPALKVLIISGYADAHGEIGIARLAKPFRLDDLADAMAALAAEQSEPHPVIAH